jgi:thioredoxin family protein
VVLVNFCTYTCINWIRTLPYVRGWAETYESQGLVVIGAHTPEFSFEHDIDNVREALGEMGVKYPIAVDSDYAVWNAVANRYWPASYFIDAEGRIRHHHFGEGDYEESERVIRDLLIETGASNLGPDLLSVNPVGPEVGADWENVQSPETYLGHERTRDFTTPGGMSREGSHIYTGAEYLSLNQWTLIGDWTAESENVRSNKPNGRIEMSFHARDVNLVMGPMVKGTSVPFRVTIDGEPPLGSSGFDVDGDGVGTLNHQRMYQLARQQKWPIVDRVFAIEFLDRGAEAFVFTFG